MKQLFTALVVLATLTGCRSGAAPVDQRFREHFQLTEQELAPAAARQALLARLPAGTPEPEVYKFLQQSGVGRDNLSAFYPAGDDGRIFCHIDADPTSYNPLGPKHKGYAIYLILDARRQLYDIQVQPWPPEAEAQIAPTLVKGREKAG